ncbi:MAG TPA: LLM class F420-dependent oxidoreductase [Actinomycetota bacterium]|jgi:probable F420-dependent oxidoreductase
MARFKVGVQLEPQDCTIDELRRAWRDADEMGADSIWTWDHFFPLHGDPDGAHFEGWSLLGAMACDTRRASIGVLVTCNSYRSPDMLADMARTVDHLSGGRVILGLGAGWCERDYEEYGFEFGTVASRLEALEQGIVRIEARLARLNPPPRGPLPLLIGGEGERITLRLTAEHADMWNGFGPIERFTHKNSVLNDWCHVVGRDPSAIERTVLLNQSRDAEHIDAFLGAGAQHLLVPARAPFDLGELDRLLLLAKEGG